MKQMIVFKDGDQWIFALPDFKNLQVSPAEIAHVNSAQNKQMELIYRNLELDQKVCDVKSAIDSFHDMARNMQK